MIAEKLGLGHRSELFDIGTTWRRYALNSTSIMMGLERRFAINTNNRPYYYYQNP